MKMQYLVVICSLTMILLTPFFNTSPRKANPITIRIIYDNNQFDPQLKVEWGFSCFISGTQKTILFDTGGDGSTLLSNMKKLKITPEQVDLIFLSHIHGDHTGGLLEFLKKNNKVKVFLPHSFPSTFKKDITALGAQYIEVIEPIEICKDVFSSGELGISIKEQSLIIKTEKGLVIITGCAHPGIVDIVKKAKKLLNQNIYLVMGGFHLLGSSKEVIEKVVYEFKKMGIEKVAPCHCSGKLCLNIFENKYGPSLIKLGVSGEVKIE
jgi:7,8-dihydropterin-6-yl-methyl-4-(beta-D-ribofuranosyl)aminobenzene 5'-phosphate synthase